MGRVITLSISAFHWQGTDISEVDLPVIGLSVGAAKRHQSGQITKADVAISALPIGGYHANSEK